MAAKFCASWDLRDGMGVLKDNGAQVMDVYEGLGAKEGILPDDIL